MNRAINKKFCVEAIEYFEDDFYYLVDQIENGIRYAVDRKEDALLIKQYFGWNDIPPHKTLYNNDKLWNKIYEEFKLRDFDIFVCEEREIFISWKEDYSEWGTEIFKYKI